jgi:hypothetical protein
MKKEEALLDEMKKIASQIQVAKITNQPQARLKQQFAKLQSKYKPYWIKQQNARQKII